MLGLHTQLRYYCYRRVSIRLHKETTLGLHTLLRYYCYRRVSIRLHKETTLGLHTLLRYYCYRRVSLVWSDRHTSVTVVKQLCVEG
jgi:hypothetical protein